MINHKYSPRMVLLTLTHNQTTHSQLISGSCFSRNILTITRSSTILLDENSNNKHHHLYEVLREKR